MNGLMKFLDEATPFEVAVYALLCGAASFCGTMALLVMWGPA